MDEVWMPYRPWSNTYHATRGTGRVAVCGAVLGAHGLATTDLPKGARPCPMCVAMGAVR